MKIAICNNCDCPLIWTFAFNGAEFWCPECGCTYGAFDVDKVDWSWRLHHKRLKYQKASKNFLRARSTIICAMFKRRGEWVKFMDLPLKSQQYYKSQAKSWKYKITY